MVVLHHASNVSFLFQNVTHGAIAAPQLHAGINGLDRVFNFPADTESLAITVKGAVEVTEVRGIGVALDVPNFLVSARQIPLQLRIVGRFASEAIQIFQGATDNQTPRRRGALQILYRIMNLEHQRVRQTANVVEPPFCPSALLIRSPRFDCSRSDPTESLAITVKGAVEVTEVRG